MNCVCVCERYILVWQNSTSCNSRKIFEHKDAYKCISVNILSTSPESPACRNAFLHKQLSNLSSNLSFPFFPPIFLYPNLFDKTLIYRHLWSRPTVSTVLTCERKLKTRLIRANHLTSTTKLFPFFYLPSSASLWVVNAMQLE